MKRLLLPVTIIVAIVLIILGNVSWNQKVDNTVKEAEERISSPISKDGSLQNESINGIDEDNPSTLTEGKGNSESSSQNGSSDITNSNSLDKKSGSSNPNNSDSTENDDLNEQDSKLTLESIKNEYYEIFTELEAQETSKVDQLIVQAKADYVSKKSSISQLIGKYEEVSSLMEKNADRTFNIIYEQLQYDLDRNGYDPEEAQEFRATYTAKKQERKARINSQIESFLNS